MYIFTKFNVLSMMHGLNNLLNMEYEYEYLTYVVSMYLIRYVDCYGCMILYKWIEAMQFTKIIEIIREVVTS